jgi:hypothetical protein
VPAAPPKPIANVVPTPVTVVVPAQDTVPTPATAAEYANAISYII